MIKVNKIYLSMVVQLNIDLIQEIFLKYPNIEKSVIKKRDNLTKELNLFISNAQKKNEINDSYSSEEIIEIIQGLILFYAKYDPKNLESKLKNSLSMLYFGLCKHVEVT